MTREKYHHDNDDERYQTNFALLGGAPNETVKSNEEGDLFALTEAKYGVDQREETGIMEERHDSCRC